MLVPIPIGDIAPRRTTPWFNYGIIGLNILVFVLFFFRRDYETIVVSHGLTPAAWSFPDMLTSMFLHASLFHLAGNLLLLWIVGDNVEDCFGHAAYVVFYLACGFAAAFAQIAMTSGDAAGLPMIGASGAISGMVGAYLVLFPNSRIKMLLWIFVVITVVRLPSWIVIFAWLVWQGLLLWDVVAGRECYIAVWAHLGGFALGFGVAFLGRGLGMLKPPRMPRTA